MTERHTPSDSAVAHHFDKWLILTALCIWLSSGCAPPDDTEDDPPISDDPTVPTRADFFGINGGTLTSDAAGFQSLGIRNIRTQVLWADFQGADCAGNATTTVSFINFDQKVRTAAENGLTVMALLYGTRLPPFQGCPGGADARQFPPPGSLLYNDYVLPGGFVWQVVQRYGFNGTFWSENPGVPYHPIRVWEVWNEENLRINNWGEQNVQPQNYAKFLIDTAIAIRHAQKQQSGQPVEETHTKVLMGGLAPFEKDYTVDKYLDSIYAHPQNYTAAQFHAAFDGLSFHPYALTGSPDSVIAHIHDARSALDQRRGALNGGSDANKTLWITEIGWPIMDLSAVGEPQQVSYLIQTLNWIYANAGANKIKHAAWYAYSDGVIRCDSWPCWDLVAGLKRADGSQRPAWCAYMNLIGVNSCAPSKWYRDNLGGTITSDPDISSWGPGRLDVFARGVDNSLWHKWWYNLSGWSGWENLGGNLASGPSAVSWGLNRIDVVARAVDNSVLHWWWDNGGWYFDNLGGNIVSDPDISSWGPARLDVFGRGPANTLWHRAWSATTWFPWENLGGNIDGGPGTASWASGRFDVAARTPSNTIAHWWFDNGWHADSIPGTITSDPDLSSRGAGRLDVFAQNSDGMLHHLAWENPTGWGTWEWLGGPLEGGPAAVSWEPADRIDVVGKTSDHSVYHWYWIGP